MKRLFPFMMLLAVVLFVEPAEPVQASHITDSTFSQTIDFEQASAQAVAVADESVGLQIESLVKQTVKEAYSFLPGSPPTVFPGDQDHQLIVIRPKVNFLDAGYRPYLARSNLHGSYYLV